MQIENFCWKQLFQNSKLQVIVALYRRFWYKSLHNINFDNPVYRPSKCTEENVNMPDRETSLLPPTTDHPHHHQYHQSIGIIPGFPTALPSASSTTISFSSSGSSSAIDPNSATRTFTSTTLVQDATEVRYTLVFVEHSNFPTRVNNVKSYHQHNTIEL